MQSVLIVDDDRGPRESLRLILRSHFEVCTAESGEQALRLVSCHRLDAVTLDLKMPGLSGSKTLAALKKIDPDLEVVIVTGYGTLENAVEVMGLGIFDMLPKPFESQSVLDAVRRAAERSAENRSRRSELAHEAEEQQGEPSPQAGESLVERLLRGKTGA